MTCSAPMTHRDSLQVTGTERQWGFQEGHSIQEGHFKTPHVTLLNSCASSIPTATYDTPKFKGVTFRVNTPTSPVRRLQQKVAQKCRILPNPPPPEATLYIEGKKGRSSDIWPSRRS